MEQITIQISDKNKARALLELLAALDFVDSIKTSETENGEKIADTEDSADFFSLAGIWQDRDITIESIREKAWPRQSS